MTSAFDHAAWFAAGANEALVVGRFFEVLIEAIYSSILAPGDLAIDGGAIRGRHTFPMRRRTGDPGLVIAVEPLLTLALPLMGRINLERIGKVLVLPQALAMQGGVVEFQYVAGCDYYSGIRRAQSIPPQMLDSVRTIQVPATTLDAIVANSERDSVRFIKLDLEGGEYHALLGASRVMQSAHPPMIVFEHARQAAADVYDYQRDDWFEQFAQCGYQVFDLFGRPFTPAQWDAQDVPWYLIAAKRAQDLHYIGHQLPAEIARQYQRLPL